MTSKPRFAHNLRRLAIVACVLGAVVAAPSAQAALYANAFAFSSHTLGGAIGPYCGFAPFPAFCGFDEASYWTQNGPIEETHLYMQTDPLTGMGVPAGITHWPLAYRDFFCVPGACVAGVDSLFRVEIESDFQIVPLSPTATGLTHFNWNSPEWTAYFLANAPTPIAGGLAAGTGCELWQTPVTGGVPVVVAVGVWSPAAECDLNAVLTVGFQYDLMIAAYMWPMVPPFASLVPATITYNVEIGHAGDLNTYAGVIP